MLHPHPHRPSHCDAWPGLPCAGQPRGRASQTNTSRPGQPGDTDHDIAATDMRPAAAARAAANGRWSEDPDPLLMAAEATAKRRGCKPNYCTSVHNSMYIHQGLSGKEVSQDGPGGQVADRKQGSKPWQHSRAHLKLPHVVCTFLRTKCSVSHKWHCSSRQSALSHVPMMRDPHRHNPGSQRLTHAIVKQNSNPPQTRYHADAACPL